MNKSQSRACLVAAMMLALSLGSILPASARDVPVDNSGPGEDVPVRIQEQAAAKQALADAYLAAKYGDGDAPAVVRAARSYSARYPSAADANVRRLARPRSARAAIRTAASFAVAKLDVDHYAQINGFYCGPASGKMILKYKGDGTSALTGDSQIQANIANTSHMRTDINGRTTWSSGLFRSGLNKWRQGTPTGWYVDDGQPTAAQFKSHVVYDVDHDYPLAADTVELEGSRHYNNHPKNRTIGHWIVGTGYENFGDTTRFNDPATSVWTGVQPKFTHDTSDFANWYLQSNGVTW